jgi:uncharacterized protein with NRDE domain
MYTPAYTVLAANTDQTPAAITMGASTFLARLAAGGIVAATVAQVKTLLGLPEGGRIAKATKSLVLADLTDAAHTQAFVFDSALPATAVLLYAQVNVTQAYTDGATGAFTADVGFNGGDTDAILAAADLAAIARVGAPLGVAPAGFVGAVTPVLTVNADVNVNTATGGTLTAEVYYFEAANL